MFIFSCKGDIDKTLVFGWGGNKKLNPKAEDAKVRGQGRLGWIEYHPCAPQRKSKYK